MLVSYTKLTVTHQNIWDNLDRQKVRSCRRLLAGLGPGKVKAQLRRLDELEAKLASLIRERNRIASVFRDHGYLDVPMWKYVPEHSPAPWLGRRRIYSKCPASGRARTAWLIFSAAMGKPPNALYRSARGWYAEYKRPHDCPLNIPEEALKRTNREN